jgi:acetyl-CoA C-acetyltransferase
MHEVVIVGFARTAIGSMGGTLAHHAGAELGAAAIRGALARAGLCESAALALPPAGAAGAAKGAKARGRWQQGTLAAGDERLAAVDECIMGTVVAAGGGQAPARQAALRAGLGAATVCTTVNKVRAGARAAAVPPPYCFHLYFAPASVLVLLLFSAAGVRVRHEGRVAGCAVHCHGLGAAGGGGRL